MNADFLGRSVARRGKIHRNSCIAVASTIEQLENRTLLTAVVVNTTLDGLFPPSTGLVSLRNAIATANSSSTPTTITFNTNVFAAQQTILLSGSGLTFINTKESTTINGPAAGLILSGGGKIQGLQINSGVNATLSGISITNFTPVGIFNLGSLTFIRGTISGNIAPTSANGGGIYSGGSLALSDSTVSGNVDNSNRSGSYGGGAGIFNDQNALAVLSHVNVVNNAEHGDGEDGGGIFNHGTIKIDRSLISGNKLDNPIGGSGGGIANVSGKLILTDSTVSGNSAKGSGGGISSFYGSVSLTDVTVSGNSAEDGGGVSDESADPSSYTNVTIAGNSAGYSAGGIALDGFREAITNCTISGNTAPMGGGVFYGGGGALPHKTTIANSIIAGNKLSGNTGSGPDVLYRGIVFSLGFNLIGITDGTSGWLASDLKGSSAHPVTPGLGPLASNGGLTQTMLPLASSPAIDHGFNALIPKGITTDQRGLPRIINATVDIGAVEVQPPLSSIGAIAGSVFSDTNANGKRDAGENGMAGVTVFIDANKNGKMDAGEPITSTDSLGNFKFTNVAVGSSRIREVLPANYALIAPAAGYFDVPVISGATAGGSVFADAPATAVISGRVFNDGNGNGVRDPGEAGMGLWTVFIDYNNDGKIDGNDVSVVTDFFGNWSFKGLVAGTYVVRVAPAAGLTATKPTGSLLTIKLIAGQASSGNLFGEKTTT